MLKVHAAAGANVPPQGGFPELNEKSALFAPLRVAAVSVRVVVPTLVMVTDDETVTPRVTVPKLMVVGANLRAVPIPDRAAVCGLVTSVSATLMVPVLGPTTVGLKATFTIHVAPTAITLLFVQVVPEALTKSPDMVTAGLPSV